jgi:hypothetical protein
LSDHTGDNDVVCRDDRTDVVWRVSTRLADLGRVKLMG